MSLTYSEAKKKLAECNFLDCESYFESNRHFLEFGYCKLLRGNLQEAKEILALVRASDVRADWASTLIQFIEQYVKVVPSYFQIRNFLEIDINLLIKSAQSAYVENIINGADLFFSVNPESYKFIARVLINNDFHEVAFDFLLRAKDNFYFDPELHLMMAQCYIKQGNLKLAKASVGNCLSILPEYFPAKEILKRL